MATIATTPSCCGRPSTWSRCLNAAAEAEAAAAEAAVEAAVRASVRAAGSARRTAEAAALRVEVETEGAVEGRRCSRSVDCSSSPQLVVRVGVRLRKWGLGPSLVLGVVLDVQLRREEAWCVTREESVSCELERWVRSGTGRARALLSAGPRVAVRLGSGLVQGRGVGAEAAGRRRPVGRWAASC